MHREDPCTPHEPAICSAINSLPAPYARAGHMAFSSNPYRFMPGQPGQPGQTPESLANRSFRIFNLHTYTGTQPGHAGTIRFQDVSGRAKHHIYGRAPPSRVVRFRRFCSHSQAGPSVPPCSLVGVARHWLEALAAAQPIGRRRIGPTGDQLTAGGRQASAIVRQVPALRTAPPVVPGPFRRTNARQPGGRVHCLACRRAFLSRLGNRQGRCIAPVQHAVPINHRRSQTTPAGYEPRGRAPRLADSPGPTTAGLSRCPCDNSPWRPASAPRPPRRVPCTPRRAKPR